MEKDQPKDDYFRKTMLEVLKEMKEQGIDIKLLQVLGKLNDE